MAHFNRKKTRRCVRCTMCTSYRWMGNAASRGYGGAPDKHRKAKAERNRISPTEMD